LRCSIPAGLGVTYEHIGNMTVAVVVQNAAIHVLVFRKRHAVQNAVNNGNDPPPLNRTTNYESQAARKGQEVFDERTEERTTARRGIRRASGSAALNASDLERRPPASPRLATASLRHGGSAIRHGG